MAMVYQCGECGKWFGSQGLPNHVGENNITCAGHVGQGKVVVGRTSRNPDGSIELKD